MNEEVKKFTSGFFSNLGADIAWENEILIVKNVPKNFEDLYGKSSPYHVIFEHEKESKDHELVASGSFMLNCMKEFLENKGQTTLLKLNVDINSEEEIKKNFRFLECSVARIDKKIEYKTIIRFTFLTTLQYLNEKEQVLHDIYADGDRIVDFNPDNFKTCEGKTEDVHVKDVKLGYMAAKERLKILLDEKIKKTGEMLDLRLNKEIERIKQHYGNRNKEVDDVIGRNLGQIKELENHLAKSNDKEAIDTKIKKIKEINQQLENPAKKDILKKEEIFLINDETQKHSLNINNKMINTSIIYYPEFKFDIFLKNPETMRLVQLKYNPIDKSMSKLACECCKKEISEIRLCSSGHVSCENCLRNCEECRKQYCINCLKINCFLCEKRLCKRCAKKCIACGKYKCISHMKDLSTCKSCEGKGLNKKRTEFSR